MQDEIQKAVAEELGISELSNEEQQNLISQMTGIMLKAATIAILEKLPEAKRDEFIAISDKEDEAAMSSFLQTELPDSQEIVRSAVAEEVRRFKEFQATLSK